jgi:hypothetical protein
MAKKQLKGASPLPTVEKALSGIRGLDEIRGGGLPWGRPTLVCASAGCGKTMLGVEFLPRGDAAKACRAPDPWLSKGLMSAKELSIEVEDLQRRLAEAEDTLRTIRGGEVDAVVVSGPKGQLVYVLQSAEERYRIFLETMLVYCPGIKWTEWDGTRDAKLRSLFAGKNAVPRTAFWGPEGIS